MIFAVFDPSPLTLYKLQFLHIYIFAVLLLDLSRISCYSVQRMPLKMNIRHQADLNQSTSATTGTDFRKGMAKRVKLRRLAKFRGNRYNRRRDMAIFRFCKMAAAAILDL